MIDIKIKVTHPNFKNPIKGSKDAACWDVYAADIEFKDNIAIVNLGFATEFSPQYKGIIVPRSNLSNKRWSILNSPCQIDADYRGDWMIKFTPIPDLITTDKTPNIKIVTPVYKDFPYKVGERVAQIYFEKVNNFNLLYVRELGSTARNTGGFGNSGLK